MQSNSYRASPKWRMAETVRSYGTTVREERSSSATNIALSSPNPSQTNSPDYGLFQVVSANTPGPFILSLGEKSGRERRGKCKTWKLFKWAMICLALLFVFLLVLHFKGAYSFPNMFVVVPLTPENVANAPKITIQNENELELDFSSDEDISAEDESSAEEVDSQFSNVTENTQPLATHEAAHQKFGGIVNSVNEKSFTLTTQSTLRFATESMFPSTVKVSSSMAKQELNETQINNPDQKERESRSIHNIIKSDAPKERRQPSVVLYSYNDDYETTVDYDL